MIPPPSRRNGKSIEWSHIFKFQVIPLVYSGKLLDNILYFPSNVECLTAIAWRHKK